MLGSESEQPALTQEALMGHINHLYSEDGNLREEASRALFGLGDAVIPHLIRVLEDKSHPKFDIAVTHAAGILGRLKATAALQQLMDLLDFNVTGMPVVMKGEERVKETYPAYNAVVMIGIPSVPLLKSELIGSISERRLLTLRALGSIGGAEAADALRCYISGLEIRAAEARTILRDVEQGRRESSEQEPGN